MPAYQAPAVLRLRVRQSLRRYRDAAGLTQRDVAKAMDWSPSKLIRIEAGEVSISMNDLRALLNYYGEKDDEQIEDLILAARNSKKSSWSDYKDVVSPEAVAFFQYEESAVLMRQYEPLLVPGLLQTEEYMRALFGDVSELDQPRTERMVQARLERQQLLERDETPQLFYVIDEAVLLRRMGGTAIMLKQLDWLDELAARDDIVVQVVPFERGGYPGLLGSFTTLEMPDDLTLVYLESRVEAVYRDNAGEIGVYVDTYQRLEEQVATPPKDFSKWISKAKDVIRRG